MQSADAAPPPMEEGRDVWYHEALEAADDECKGRATRYRASALHPLLVGLDRCSKGDLPHHRRLPDRRGDGPRVRVRPYVPRRTSTGVPPDVGWVTGHTYIIFVPMLQRCDLGDVRGAAGLPRQGGALVPRTSSSGSPSTTSRRPRSASFMKWGAEHPNKHDLSSLRLLVSVGEPIKTEGVAVVLEGDRRRALPDRGHLVADRDGPYPHLAAARHHLVQAGIGNPAAARRRCRRGGRVRWGGDRQQPGAARAAQAVAGHAARAL